MVIVTITTPPERVESARFRVYMNIFSNKHLEIYPNRVYNIKRKGGNHMEEKKECCCHHKTKERSDKEYKDLINRLSRIEGQVRGIKKMVVTSQPRI